MNDIFDESYDLYQKARASISQTRWDTYLLAICTLLHEKRCNLNELVVEARNKRREIGNPRADQHLWIFSQRSGSALKRGLEQSDLRAGFAQVLAYTEPEKGRGLLRYFTRKTSNPHVVREFLSLYILWIVNCCRPRTTFVIPHLDSSVPEFALVPKPHTEAESKQRLYEEIQLYIASRELLAQKSVFPLHPKWLRGEMCTQSLIRKIAQRIDLELDEIEWRAPQEWQSVLDFTSTLAQCVLNKKTWPIFSEAETPTLPAFSVSSYMHTTPIPGVMQLIEDHIGTGAKAWYDTHTAVSNGRLPIGIKLHFTKPSGLETRLEGTPFRLEQHGTKKVSVCQILPVVGNLTSLAGFLKDLESICGTKLLDNPEVSIQVCSAGKLSGRRAALLGICFYLGSDKLRRYVREEFITSQNDKTGGRLVIYGKGVLQRTFDWWGKDKSGELHVTSFPDHHPHRTDVLTCQSLLDIDNVNLVATLLVHSTYGGYWEDLGKQFESDVVALLEQHQLLGLLDIPWVYDSNERQKNTEDEQDPKGELFFTVFEDLMAYAFDEYRRIQRARTEENAAAATSGILFEMREILDQYRIELNVRSPQEGR